MYSLQSAPFLTNDRILKGIEAGNGFLYAVEPTIFLLGFDEESYCISILSQLTLTGNVTSMVLSILFRKSPLPRSLR